MFPPLTVQQAIVLRIIQQAGGTATHATIASTLITNHGVSDRTRVYSYVAEQVQALRALLFVAEEGQGDQVGDLSATTRGVEALVAFKNLITPYLPS